MVMGSLEELAAASCSGSYDPEKFGAQCSKCYLYKLRQGGPVPPEINPGAKILVAAEGPGEEEVKFNRPLIGKSGTETVAGLATVGIARSQVSLTNCFVCRPPGNNLDALLLRMKKENKERVLQGLEPYLSPMEACRPRFAYELRFFEQVISLGKPAFQAIVGSNQSIMDARGMPVEGILDGKGHFHSTLHIPEPGEVITKLRLMPTVHPAFVLRKKRWRGTFRVDLSRAVRWFSGELLWKEPESILQPSPQQLEEFLLKEKHRFVVYDVETGSPNLDMPHLGKEPLLARLRCIGFSTTEFGMVVPFLSIDGSSTFYPSDEQEAINEICKAHFLDPKVVKAGHNINYYDQISIETNLGVTPAPTIDTIMLHRGAESELPHRLGYVGTTWTGVTKQWKTEHTAITAKTDRDLWIYNLTDCVVTARIVQPLIEVVQARGLSNVVGIHHELQGVCVGMHRNGLFVDQPRRREHDVWLKREAAQHRQALRQIVDNPSFNPNSRDQVAEILFERWGLMPEVIYENDPSASKKIKKAYTAAGAPSTGDDNLRAMLLFCQKNSPQWSFVRSLRKFRGAVKLRGTNIIPLRPIDEPYFESDDLAINLDVEEEARAIDEWDEAQAEREHDAKGPSRRLKVQDKKPGLVLFDGRVHPHWNAHTATTQRLASSEPNGQNWSRKIRDIVHAQQMADWVTTHILINGRTVAWRHPEKFTRALIAADMDQLELRFAAALAGAARYLEVFANGGDPHAVTCEMLYGNSFKHASEDGKKRLRDFAKRFSYAVLYKATVETVHETLASSENNAGDLVFPDLTLRETRNFHERWLRASPEFGDVDGSGGWWLRELQEYRRQGFLVEPIFGWRRDFLDGEEDSENEIVNFKCQAGGSAVVHLATLKYLKYMPFGRWGPGTGLIQQGHDALVVEVPATHGPASFRIDKYGEPELDKFGQPMVDKWCAKGCKCITEQSRRELQECMTVDGRQFGLPVMFTASGKAGFRWSEV
jgi:DNA polymerase I-like protein with 3'-5' exonuclease and polymerase domains/uracil-DNA glycosylase